MASTVPAVLIAWALKDEAMAAWGTAPVRALRCVALLDTLCHQHGSAEITALLHWTRGLAALTEGRMADAIDGFDSARVGLMALQRPHEAAQTQVPKMIALAMTGRHDEAQACGEAVRAAFIAAGDLGSVGKVELNLGTMLSRRDRHAEAAQRFRSAAVHAARAADRELSIRADIALADALTWLSDFDEALRINQRASVRAQAHGLTVLCALARNAIGRIEINRGAFHHALREIAAASRLLAEVGAPVQQRIEVDKALADAYAAVQLLPEARAIYDRVIDMAHNLGTVSEEARARVQRARVARQQGDRAGAEADFALARSLFDRDGNSASLAYVDLAMASMVLDAGDAAGAKRAATALAALLAPAGKRGWWLEARVLQAKAAAVAGDLAAARVGFEGTLAEAHDVAQVRFACHHGLASLAWRERQEGPARHHLGLAMAQLDDLRAALPGDVFRSAVAASGEALHDLLVRIAVDSGQPAQGVWQAIERGHARALAFAAAQPGSDFDGASPERTALQWTRERQRDALARGDNDRGAALEAQALEQEQALLEAHRRALLESAPSAQPAPADAAPAPGALQAGQAIVVYHRLAERLVACVATSGAVSSFVVDTTGLDVRLDALRLQLDTMRLPGAAQRHGAARTCRPCTRCCGRRWRPPWPVAGAWWSCRMNGCTTCLSRPCTTAAAGWWKSTTSAWRRARGWRCARWPAPHARRAACSRSVAGRPACSTCMRRRPRWRRHSRARRPCCSGPRPPARACAPLRRRQMSCTWPATACSAPTTRCSRRSSCPTGRSRCSTRSSSAGAPRSSRCRRARPASAGSPRAMRRSASCAASCWPVLPAWWRRCGRWMTPPRPR
jgi:tetratricopeptide (TPR) repeat protein